MNGRQEPRKRPVHRHRLLRDPALGFVLVAVGVGLIALVSRLEAGARSRQPWAEAVVVPDGEALWEGATAVAARRLPLSNFPEEQALVESMREVLRGEDLSLLDLGETEWIFSVDTPVEIFEPLLASGRLPNAGTREVLAGVLARLDTFTLDGEEFAVVGRLERGTAGLAFAYVLPRDGGSGASFTEAKGATKGWLDAQGYPRLLELGETGDQRLEALAVLGRLTPTQPLYAWLTMAGLACVAVGGAAVQIRLFQALARRKSGLLGPIFGAVAERPILLWVMHGFLYGVFFGMMGTGLRHPVMNMRMRNLVAHTFLEGDLSYIGAAYISGNVPLAALATFLQNYVVATVLLTVLPSLVIPFFGVAKNLISFAVVGFAMAPMWTELASTFVYHSITMTLELEGYVVASFVVCVLPLCAIRGISRGNFVEELIRGFKVTGSGTLLAGIMLAVAALYEATTLILLK